MPVRPKRLVLTLSSICLAGLVWIRPAIGDRGRGSSATVPAEPRPFVPTPQEVVERMLELAGVTKNDVVYDLGCGDGRIVITAAKKYGARGVGVDLDPERIAESKANAEKAGVAKLVEFRLQDAMTVDVSPPPS